MKKLENFCGIHPLAQKAKSIRDFIIYNINYPGLNLQEDDFSLEIVFTKLPIWIFGFKNLYDSGTNICLNYYDNNYYGFYNNYGSGAIIDKIIAKDYDHIVLTKTSQKIKFYLNSVLISESDYISNLPLTSINIGCLGYNQPTNSKKGSLHLYRCFNYELTSDEIKNLYNNGRFITTTINTEVVDYVDLSNIKFNLNDVNCGVQTNHYDSNGFVGKFWKFMQTRSNTPVDWRISYFSNGIQLKNDAGNYIAYYKYRNNIKFNQYWSQTIHEPNTNDSAILNKVKRFSKTVGDPNTPFTLSTANFPNSPTPNQESFIEFQPVKLFSKGCICEYLPSGFTDYYCYDSSGQNNHLKYGNYYLAGDTLKPQNRVLSNTILTDQITISGNSTPNIVPTMVGLLYKDLSNNGKLYISVGTSRISDWKPFL